MASANDPVAQSIRELITSYHELNPQAADELEEEPSALEFMRYVARNRPFVVRNGAAAWKSNQKWNAQYLADVMDEQLVNVAITNKGNADAVVEAEDGSLVFVEPYERDEPFSSVLRKIQNQELHGMYPEVIRNAQTQNDNLRGEYFELFSDVPKDIPFARIALQQGPDAINFWLGNSRSTTALHKDNYENIYVQVLGQKHFTLMPPVECACVNERELPTAKYAPRSARSSGEEDEDDEALNDLKVNVAEPTVMVPCPTWDPDELAVRPTRFSELATPVRVTLNPGDMLYLPAMWYHKVAQSCSEEGICCAINYWYDMDFGGPFWSLCSFARTVGGTANGTHLGT